MPPPRIAPEVLASTVAAVLEHGGATAAAIALGIPRGTIEARITKAITAGLTTREALRAGEAPFSLPDELPSELPTADELIARRSKQFARKKDAKEARHLIPVQVHLEGPVGVAIPGDPHLDDDGTDIDLIRAHVDLFNATEGLFALAIGDYSNNWIGRLARLYGQQGLSAAEAWVLVEWYVHAVPWLAMVGGNHDAWSGAGDPIQWMAASARKVYEANGVRLGLTFPNGRVIRVNARHDFSGKSQYDTAFGVAKAARFGWRDHILVAGHTHVSGYHPLRDPSNGLLSHALRVGSYKTYDRFAEERGLPNQTFSVCPVCVIRPQFADDDPRLIQVFFEPETAASFLTWLRKRKSERVA
jgi:hypothetical protein